MLVWGGMCRRFAKLLVVLVVCLEQHDENDNKKQT